MVERSPEEAGVVSSILTLGTNKRRSRPCLSRVRRFLVHYTSMTSQRTKRLSWARTIHRRLQKVHKPVTMLRYRSPWQLLVAVILSAQSTDSQVNKITPRLFRAAGTPQKTLAIPRRTLEQLIYSSGFYRSKARHIHGAARVIAEQFNGRVPRTMNELLTLPGVARKTANVVLGEAYGVVEGVTVDTHVIRLANRLGLTTHKDPRKIEQDLMKLLPRSAWREFAHELVWHGRKVCTARKPNCGVCPLRDRCPSAFTIDT